MHERFIVVFVRHQGTFALELRKPFGVCRCERLLHNVLNLTPRDSQCRHVKIPRALGGGQSHFKPCADSCIVDGNLCFRYPHLERQQQEEIAVECGSGRQQIMQDLQAIVAATLLL